MPKKKSDSIVDTSRYDYKRVRIRDAKTGRIKHSANNDDAVARALLVHTANGGTIKQVIKDNDLTAKFKGREDSNPGLLRMSVGVSLRGLINNGTPVKIGSITVKTLKQPVALPKVEASAPGGGTGGRKAKKAKAKRTVKTTRKRKPAAQTEAPAAQAA